ncbi:MAG: Zn-ribbon domain-containing OB-fold protein [Parvibaculales bacterium]
MTNVFASMDPPTLKGGRIRSTGQFIFPLPEGDEETVEAVALHRVGTVWSFTVQRFAPKSPPYNHGEDFAPYIVAYVSLEGQLMVEARLVGMEPEEVEIGMAVELTAFDFKRLDTGEIDQAHAFQPIKGDTI